MPKSLVISIDAMGGDNAPHIVIDGIAHFVKSYGQARNIRFLLHGDAGQLTPLIDSAGIPAGVCEIRHTATVIDMDAKASHAVRRGKGTSMWNAIAAVKVGEAHAGVSAGIQAR